MAAILYNRPISIKLNSKFRTNERMLYPRVGGYMLKTRKNALVECLNYQIPVTQLKGAKGNGDMQAAKRD